MCACVAPELIMLSIAGTIVDLWGEAASRKEFIVLKRRGPALRKLAAICLIRNPQPSDNRSADPSSNSLKGATAVTSFGSAIIR